MEYLGLTTYTLFPFQAPQYCRHIWMPNGFRDFLKGFLACLLSCGFWKTWPPWEKSFERPQMHITSIRALRGQSYKDGAMAMYWFETNCLTHHNHTLACGCHSPLLVEFSRILLWYHDCQFGNTGLYQRLYREYNVKISAISKFYY